MTQNGRRSENGDTLSTLVLRSELIPLEGKRIEITGVFDRMGTRKNSAHGEKIVTALVQCIEYEGRQLCDHLHVQRAETIDAMHLVRGTIIRFLGVVMSYRKYDPALCRWVEDYTLWNPTAVTVIRNQTPPILHHVEEEPKMTAPVQTQTLPTARKPIPDFSLSSDNPGIAYKNGIEYVTANELSRRIGYGTKTAGVLRIRLEKAGVEPGFEYASGPYMPSKYFPAKEAMAVAEGYKPKPRKDTPGNSEPIPKTESAPNVPESLAVSEPRVITVTPPTPLALPTPPKTDKATLVGEVQRLVEVYGAEAVKKALTFVTE